MKIASAEFVKSAFEKRHWPTDGLPEIAFLGRSNVGKSSLLNSLLGRKGLARTSNTPGRTQSINFFLINNERGQKEQPGGKRVERIALTNERASAKKAFYFVDLPGYGYARVSKTMRADWGKMAEEYLSGRDELVLCVHLIDLRHEPTALDIQLNEWLVANEKPFVLAATKADKLSNNNILKQLKLVGRSLTLGKLITYSSVTGKGRDELWEEIRRAVRH